MKPIKNPERSGGAERGERSEPSGAYENERRSEASENPERSEGASRAEPYVMK